MNRAILASTLFVVLLVATPAHAKLTAAAEDSFQPPEERKAQETLPQAKDTVWKTLAKTKIKVDEDKGIYKADIPNDVKKLDGQMIKISGFIVPLDPSETFKHFLLSKRTPTCPYCPPGAPNEVIEVYTAKDIKFKDGLETVEGHFELTDQEEAGIFFTLKDATEK